MLKKRLLGVLLVLALLISIMIPGVYAANGDGQEVFPDNSAVYMNDDDLGAGSGDGFEQDDNSESPLIFGDEDEDLGASDFIVPDNAESLTYVDEDDLGAGGEEFPDNSSIDVEEDDDLGVGEGDPTEEMEAEDPPVSMDDDDDLGAGASSPRVSLSKTSVSMETGSSSTVTVGIHNFPSRIQLRVSSSSGRVCTTNWGKWTSNTTIPLTLNAKGKGSATITVKMVDYYTKKVLATNTISVKVSDKPKVTVSSSSVSVNQGSAKVVYINCEAPANSELRYSTTNPGAFTCSWGSKTSKGYPLTIKGNSTGSGTITVYLRNKSTGATLAKANVAVKVLSNAKITSSASNVTVAKGDSNTLKLTATNCPSSIYLKYSTTNTSAFSCTWGKWSGKTVPLTITGKAAGYGKISVSLCDAATNSVLATATISVTVYNSSAKIRVQSSTLKVNAGSSAIQTITVSGISNYNLSYAIGNTSYISCEWGKQSGSSTELKVTGKNVGNTQVKVTVMKNGVEVTSLTFSVNVTAAASPSVKASTSSVKLKAGNTSTVTLSFYNVSEEAYIEYSTTNTSAYSCTWGSVSSNTIPLIITGRAKGSGTVKVYLRRSSDKTVMAETSISVSVESSTAVDNISYSFGNFKGNATLSLCQFMFGYTTSARHVKNLEVGGDGNCFGFSSTSGFFYKSYNGITPSTYNPSKSAVSELVRSDRNTTIGKTVEEFLMAMQLTQVSDLYKPVLVTDDTIGNFAQTVKSQCAEGLPVLLGVWGSHNGRTGGHAILAYGIETVNSTTERLIIYDCNYPLTTRYMYLTKNSSGKYTAWSYEFASGSTWGTGKTGAQLLYCDISNLYQMWSNRGHLQLRTTNLLSVNSDDFRMYDVEGKTVAIVEDGELTYSQNGVEQIRVLGMTLDPSEDDLDCILRLPVRVYTIRNDDEDLGTLKASIVNTDYGVDVKTTDGVITLCADDSCNYASAMISNAKDAEYEINLSCSVEGEPETISCSGEAEDEVISMSLDDGSYDLCNIDSANLSLGDNNGEEVSQYNLYVEKAEHGTVTADKTEKISAGSDVKCTITPDKGYYIFDVQVDGESVGPISEYVFEDMQSAHSIQAVFKKDGDDLLLGDVNGDGKVDAKDLTALAKHLAKIEAITDENLLSNSDTNQDGKVSAEDLTKLAKYIAKIISSL